MLYGWCTTEKPKHSAAQRQQQKWHPAPSASLPLKHLMYPWLPVEEQRLIYQEAALPSGLMCTLWQFTSIKRFSICKLFCELKPPPLSSLFWCVISLSCLVVLFVFASTQTVKALISATQRGFSAHRDGYFVRSLYSEQHSAFFWVLFLVHYSMAQLSVNALWSPIYQLKRKRSGSLLF